MLYSRRHMTGMYRYQIYDLHFSLDIVRIEKEAMKYIDYKYDYIGALFSITPVRIQKDSRIFCSEVVTNILNKQIAYRHLEDSYKYSPSAVYREFKLIGGH